MMYSSEIRSLEHEEYEFYVRLLLIFGYIGGNMRGNGH